MKRIISAVVVFAVVGSALAFKVKQNPTLSTCNFSTGQCELTTDKNDEQRGTEINNPGGLYKGSGSCVTNPTCIPYTAAKVYVSN